MLTFKEFCSELDEGFRDHFFTPAPGTFAAMDRARGEGVKKRNTPAPRPKTPKQPETAQAYAGKWAGAAAGYKLAMGDNREGKRGAAVGLLGAAAGYMIGKHMGKELASKPWTVETPGQPSAPSQVQQVPSTGSPTIRLRSRSRSEEIER
jgi:hypothetical protein